MQGCCSGHKTHPHTIFFPFFIKFLQKKHIDNLPRVLTFTEHALPLLAQHWHGSGLEKKTEIKSRRRLPRIWQEIAGSSLALMRSSALLLLLPAARGGWKEAGPFGVHYLRDDRRRKGRHWMEKSPLETFSIVKFGWARFLCSSRPI